MARHRFYDVRAGELGCLTDPLCSAICYMMDSKDFCG